MKKKRIAAIAVASVLACGMFAGCDFVSTDPFKDYAQVIAEVDISKTDSFQSGDFADYAEVIEPAQISKRDLVLSFMTTGQTYVNYYGWKFGETFEYLLTNLLIPRQVYVQYATVYLLATNPEYTVEDYKQAVGGAEDKSLAGLEYFLTEKEQAVALYELRSSFNSSLDSIEEDIVKYTDEHDHDENVRTTPTGVQTENEDYYDPDYQIYTGTQFLDAVGSYEPIEGATPTTRRQAYSSFLSNIRSSGLLAPGEDTSNIESLTYFKSELKSAYEAAVLKKMSDAFEKEAEAGIDADYVSKRYTKMLDNQKETFAKAGYDFESTLDGMSDSSFVLTSPESGYGFVINILLPFSGLQTQMLNSYNKDANDTKGNRFAWRASILKNVKATDQRGSWFTGHDDYSYLATDGYGYEVGVREYLFFEDCFSTEGDAQYEALKNYYGKYTYNGTVETEQEEDGDIKYTLKPNKIDIDDFIKEMEGYLAHALGSDATVVPGAAPSANYYTETQYYTSDGKVDYEKLVYYRGNVDFGTFNANNIFVAGTPENKAFSVINELSFAYNTDTGGLNSYLGYAVTPDKTNFVSEFEYAAQDVCAKGAGNYIIVPSDYGWHIIYCTFSFTSAWEEPFEWSEGDIENEGSFSNLFFEAMKAQAVSKYSSDLQTKIINDYAEDSATIYKSRYKDLLDMD